VRRVLSPGGLLAVSASSRWNDPELAWALPRWGRASSFDAETAEPLLGKVFEVESIRTWDARLVTLPDRAAVALFLRGRGLPEPSAWRLATKTAVPLSLTKRGLVAWARKRYLGGWVYRIRRGQSARRRFSATAQNGGGSSTAGRGS